MITVDVIKAAYRQTKDGYAVTLIIHPQDRHDELALADIGSQWNMRLTPLDEHGNANPDVGLTGIAPANGREVVNPTATAAASRLTKQAGMACNDPTFRAFLWRNDMISTVDDVDEAAVAVHLICNVKSRREFIPGTPAGDRWEELYGKFISWRDVPEASP